MKLYITIPNELKAHVNEELRLYKMAYDKKEPKVAWRHLERAHILGQQWPFQHTRVHWIMLLFAFRIKSMKEIVGQLPRLIFGGVKSFVGTVPLGNTGGSDIPALKPMEIPVDLQNILMKFK